VRQEALHALGKASKPAETELLVLAAHSDNVDVQVQAAWQLSAPERIDEAARPCASTPGVRTRRNWSLG